MLFPENGQKVSCQDAKEALRKAYDFVVARRDSGDGVDVRLLATICGKAKTVIAGSTGNWGLLDSTNGYIYLGSFAVRASEVWRNNSNDTISHMVSGGCEFFCKKLESNADTALLWVIREIENSLKK
jgi:hypothetical protein